MAVTITNTYASVASSNSGMTYPSLSLTGFESRDIEKIRARFNVSPSWIHFVFPVGKERSTSQTLETRLAGRKDVFIPRTELGKQLAAIRKKALAAGLQLMNENEILDEVKRRRGEIQEHETDLY